MMGPSTGATRSVLPLPSRLHQVGHVSQGSREKGRQVRQQREGGGIALEPLWEWHGASFPNPAPFPSPTLHLPNGEGDAWPLKGK